MEESRLLMKRCGWFRPSFFFLSLSLSAIRYVHRCVCVCVSQMRGEKESAEGWRDLSIRFLPTADSSKKETGSGVAVGPSVAVQPCQRTVAQQTSLFTYQRESATVLTWYLFRYCSFHSHDNQRISAVFKILFFLNGCILFCFISE